MIKIPDIYRNNDTIYHYTSTENVLQFILKNKKLRFSPRKQSSDPIENTKEFISYSGNKDGKINLKAKEVSEFVKKEIEKTKQLCFCKNNIIKDEEHIFNISIEKYGFLKPRMWDIYGDRYKGVCLAFSLKALQNKTKFTNIVDDNIDYLTFDMISQNHQSFNVPEIIRTKQNDNFNKYLKLNIKRLFNKHIDYRDENEYRFCSFSDTQYDFVDISDALVGLFVSDIGMNNYLKDSLFDAIQEFKQADMFTISWGNLNPSIHNYKKDLDLFNDFFKTEN